MDDGGTRGWNWLTWAAPAGAVALILLGQGGLGGVSEPEVATLAVTAWMAIWWITEVVPVGATSMIPLLAFPLLSVGTAKTVAASYFNPFIVLLMAGFMAALALERWGVHRRVALAILARVGSSPRRLILGMMIAAAVMSMWISNTATTLVMLPIAMALVSWGHETEPDRSAEVQRFGVALLLGLAYAASVGGLGTPIGTPPNLIAMGAYQEEFGEPISFLEWMEFGIPTVIVMIPILWVALTRVLHKVPDDLNVGGATILAREREQQGRWSGDEISVALVFGLMALLWVTREIKVSKEEIYGWAPLLGLTGKVHDSTVAVFGALVLFAWPSTSRPGERLLDWPTALRIPWEVVLLFGGGIAIAGAFKTTGLSQTIADELGVLLSYPAPVIILSIALVVTFLTEVTSNTATATVLMPVLAGMASDSETIHPLMIMVPAVLSCSFAFMLPVATAPNAIVYGTDMVTIRQMARTGLWLNLTGAVVIMLLGVAFFG